MQYGTVGNDSAQLASLRAQTARLQNEFWTRAVAYAKVAMARRLAIRLYWMWRKGWDYEQLTKFGSHAGQPGNRVGVPLNTELTIGHPAPLLRGSSN